MWAKRQVFGAIILIGVVVMVVIAPRHRVSDWIVLLFSISGWKRISRKMPATTIVLE